MNSAAPSGAASRRRDRRGHVPGAPARDSLGAKDLLAVRGTRTTWGMSPYADRVIDIGATVFSRLSEAGAILVAKFSTGALATTARWFGGLTRNPWSREQDASGSSAGPGSATAAGLVGFSIGTDTGGSIILPSTRNDVTGLRPTFGWVSRYGAMTLVWTQDTIGPMCRSEPYRVCRRAFSLRGWSHVTTESVFPRSTRASGAAGPRARG